MAQDLNATRGYDLFAGGFKYSDEVPRDLWCSEEHVLPLVTLLRQLWGYRASLIEGQPRNDLQVVWEAVRTWSPNWAGFSQDRCSCDLTAELQLVRTAHRNEFDDLIDDPSFN